MDGSISSFETGQGVAASVRGCRSAKSRLRRADVGGGSEQVSVPAFMFDSRTASTRSSVAIVVAAVDERQRVGEHHTWASFICR